MSLLDKIKASSTIKESAILSKSKFFEKKDIITTPIPAMNIILSGEIDGGFVPGLTMWAGPSKHFKSLFSLIMVKAYMDKYPDAMCVFYDSEFGSPLSYFDSLHIDKDRVFHSPLTDLEQLRSDITNQLENLEREKDRVIFWVDSIGNSASRKEIKDAMEENDKADMTRAKTIKSLFRIIGPRLTIKDVPLVAVNHTYSSMDLYPKQVVGGGTGSYYNADNIFILGRQQEKDGTETTGYNFVINVEKSRMVKEKSKIAVNVTFDKGINKWSGLLDIAVEGGFLERNKTKPIKYSYDSLVTKENQDDNLTEEQTNNATFWNPILANPVFKDFVKYKYQLAENDLLGAENVEKAG